MKYPYHRSALRFALEAGAPAFEELAIAQEEAATGQAQVENELVFYAHLSTQAASVLKQAESVEDHEQWELRIADDEQNASGGRMRVRKTTTPDGKVEFVRTTKTKLPNGAEKEVALPSSQDEFEQFKMMAPRGMLKTRYLFAIDGREEKWEVDTYVDQKGNPSPWVKIDLELPAINPNPEAWVKPEFPEGLLDPEFHVYTKHDKTPMAQNFISELYEDVFITPNQYRFAIAAEQPTPTEEVKPAEAPTEEASA